MVTLEFPQPAAADRAAVRQLSTTSISYLSLLTPSTALATAGLRVVDVDELDTHGGSLRVYARPEECGAVHRAGEGGAGRGGVRRAAYRRGSRRIRARGAEDQDRSTRLPPHRGQRRPLRGRSTVLRARETRCLTTAASDRIFFPTRLTGARSSKGNSSRARISRSMRLNAWPRPGLTTYSSCRGTCGTR